MHPNDYEGPVQSCQGRILGGSIQNPWGAPQKFTLLDEQVFEILKNKMATIFEYLLYKGKS